MASLTSTPSSSSVAQLCPTLRSHGLQHAIPVHPRACSNSCPSSWWCHPTISSSVVPFSSHLQSFPASGSFQMSQFFVSLIRSSPHFHSHYSLSASHFLPLRSLVANFNSIFICEPSYFVCLTTISQSPAQMQAPWTGLGAHPISPAHPAQHRARAIASIPVANQWMGLKDSWSHQRPVLWASLIPDLPHEGK